MGQRWRRLSNGYARITEKARKRLCEAMGANFPLEHIPQKVEPKGDGKAGQWFCITCGDLPQNNLMASAHVGTTWGKRHKLAWRSFDSGKIEAP